MAMKRRNPYNKYISLCERETNKTIKHLEKKIKPLINNMALKVGVDLCSTQYGCYPNIPDYDYKNPKIEQFVDFIHELSDEYKIEFLFEVENGKFNWFK